MYDSIIILGATATGKTKLAIDLAKLLNTEIINADSMYIYRDLNIGTAKPTKAEMNGVKHHIIDVADPSQDFNVVDYRILAKSIINDFKKRQMLPIIVGGTGFYIDSLIKNYSYGNASHDIDIRNRLEKDLKDYGKEHLFKMLKDLDPESSQILHVNDSVRIIRALEIALVTGRKKSESLNTEEPILYNPLIIGLNMDREQLYDRINTRVDIMLENGLIDEVNNLYKRGFSPDNNQSMRGIGYREIVEYLRGNLSLEDAISKIKQHTRNYAKRQITWFKRNNKIIWFDTLKDNNIVDKILNIFKKGTTK